MSINIETTVELNPEISTANDSYKNDLIARSKRFIERYCRIPRFPSGVLQGYAITASTPLANISGIATNEFFIAINGQGKESVTITLASCTTESNTATEMQTQIQAGTADGMDEVTVSYSSPNITITSGRYGYESSVGISFAETNKHVCENLKLSPDYGGVEYRGAPDNEDLQYACVMLVEAMYRKLGTEGAKSGSIPGSFTFATHDLDPTVKSILADNRRFSL